MVVSVCYRIGADRLWREENKLTWIWIDSVGYCKALVPHKHTQLATVKQWS